MNRVELKCSIYKIYGIGYKQNQEKLIIPYNNLTTKLFLN